MATSTAHADYFSSHNNLRTRPPPVVRSNTATSPRSPRTPLLGRSISSQFGSPGAFRSEQEDTVIYELHPRYFAAGFAGESRPRCILTFSPEGGRRNGDFRASSPGYLKRSRKVRLREDWSAGHELYRTDLSSLDLGLAEDKLDRVLRIAHADYLQLDSKSRKAVLIVPSLLPSPLLEIALKVLFSHYTQPPSVTVLSHPVLSCIGAGLRTAIVVEIGWEESVVTAIGECKEIFQRRSVRAGRLLTQQLAHILEHEAQKQTSRDPADVVMTFAETDELVRQAAWCRVRHELDDTAGTLQLPMPGSDPPALFSVAFGKLAEATERTFFPSDKRSSEYDDHELPLDMLLYRVLLALPIDFRAVCLSRIVITGSTSEIPGIKRRLLHETKRNAETQGWDAVQSYGSASSKHQQSVQGRSARSPIQTLSPAESYPAVALSPLKMPIQDGVPHADRVHDDIQDPITLKAERESNKTKKNAISKVVRGVSTVGSWAAASLMTSLRVVGTHEIDRDEFIKHGLRNLAVNGL